MLYRVSLTEYSWVGAFYQSLSSPFYTVLPQTTLRRADRLVPLTRKRSELECASSFALLHAIEQGEVQAVRSVLANPMQWGGGLTAALLVPSVDLAHGNRTPLMAAAATGDYAIYTTVSHAVGRASRGNSVSKGYLYYCRWLDCRGGRTKHDEILSWTYFAVSNPFGFPVTNILHRST